MNRTTTILLLAGLLGGCGAGQDAERFTPDALSAAASIDAAFMRGVVAEIADDKYAGRGPGSAGDAAARAYLAETMASIGFAPAAGSGPHRRERGEEGAPTGVLGARAPPQASLF